MIYLLNIFVLTVFSFLTLSFFPNLRIFGVVPLLPLMFIISLSYFRKGFEPIFLAAVFGVIFDIFSPYPFGLYLSVFLLAAGIVRFMFQEGMRTLTFGSYMLISGIVLSVYYLAQVVILYIQKATFSSDIILATLSFFGVNLLCAILVYAFSGWYFESIASLNNYLKRR